MKKLQIDRSKIDKILLLALPGIGDTLLFTPAIEVIRRNFPESKITVVVMIKGSFTVLDANPDIDEVIYWNFVKEGIWRSLKFVLQLRRKKFPITIVAYPANRIEYNMINFMIGSRWRPTHKYNHLDFRCGGFLNHQVIREDDNRHNVLENLLLLRDIGLQIEPVPERLSVYLADSDYECADSFLKKHGLFNKSLIGFHPGCSELKSHYKRRWEAFKYGELGTVLKQKHGYEILVFGGPDEAELKEEVASLIKPCGIVVEGTTMLGTAALMKKCRLFVTNISSLMHMASAVQIPTVAIFGPTSHIYEAPYGTRFIIARTDLPCSPCFYYSPRHLKCGTNRDFECLKKLTVEQVYKACLELLNESS
ncbi:glycosyltransferase family 9 protein [bacterium]|nr:glycosyltransferase family 9 protein [bacterium]